MSLDSGEIICDHCGESIEDPILIRIYSVNRDCEDDGKIRKYLHPEIDPASGKRREGRRRCYKEWAESDDSFLPHGVGPITKENSLKEIRDEGVKK
jgi:hypothetical protein